MEWSPNVGCMEQRNNLSECRSQLQLSVWVLAKLQKPLPMGERSNLSTWENQGRTDAQIGHPSSDSSLFWLHME